MPKRNPNPVITHTELLNRTFNDLHREVKEWVDRVNADPAKLTALASVLDPLYAKMEAIRTMYRYETGVDM